jgi:DNA-binding NarL/FixJ family response regulator
MLQGVPDSVLIVEDDLALRDEFAAIVTQDPEHCLLAAVGSLAEARAVLRRVRPAIALVDLGLPDGDGALLIREMVAADPQALVLVTTVFGDEGHVVRAIQAGARGYLLKDSGAQEIKAALREVRTGGAPISPRVARYLLKRFRPVEAAAVGPGEKLSPREFEVLNLIARGLSAAESAAVLGVATSTVTAHTKGIYAKLAVHSRNEAVFEARQRGLLD